jgi:hypothetical protein
MPMVRRYLISGNHDATFHHKLGQFHRKNKQDDCPLP